MKTSKLIIVCLLVAVFGISYASAQPQHHKKRPVHHKVHHRHHKPQKGHKK